ncbi:hypothetical protein Ancab_025222 [Ancistrocladus abbreviatus]
MIEEGKGNTSSSEHCPAVQQPQTMAEIAEFAGKSMARTNWGRANREWANQRQIEREFQIGSGIHLQRNISGVLASGWRKTTAVGEDLGGRALYLQFLDCEGFCCGEGK